MTRCQHAEHVAVRRRLLERGRTDNSCGARAIVDNNGLAQIATQVLTDLSRQCIQPDALGLPEQPQ